MSRLNSERRRSWGWYGLAMLAVVGTLVGVAIPLVRSSDARNTTATVAQHRVQPLLLGPLANSVKLQWSASSTGRHPTVVANSMIISSSQHGLIGHDPMTGAEVWKYQRSNAQLCDWTVTNNLVIAAFRRDHGCSDLTALRGDTGQRQWYRNTDLDRVTLLSGPQVLIAASASSLLAMDPTNGQERWTYAKAGCSLSTPAVGQAGVAMVANCPTQNSQLVVHELYGKKESWSKPVDSDLRFAIVGQHVVTVSTVDKKPTLTNFDGHGSVVAMLSDNRLQELSEGGGPLISTTAQDKHLLLWGKGKVTAIDLDPLRIQWQESSDTPPVAEDAETVLTAGDSSLAIRNVSTGAPIREIPIDGAPAAGISSLARIGNSIAVTTDSDTLVYG